jgi:hypothetical protein
MFREYLDSFIKIFLDEFIVYSEMESHLQKFKLCFQKCNEYCISLNPDKCAFMVILGMILGFIISKEGKLLDLNKIHAIETCHHLRIPNRFKYSTGWHNFTEVF